MTWSRTTSSGGTRARSLAAFVTIDAQHLQAPEQVGGPPAGAPRVQRPEARRHASVEYALQVDRALRPLRSGLSVPLILAAAAPSSLPPDRCGRFICSGVRNAPKRRRRSSEALLHGGELSLTVRSSWPVSMKSPADTLDRRIPL